MRSRSFGEHSAAMNDPDRHFSGWSRHRVLAIAACSVAVTEKASSGC
jgi:hypothetical protein